MLSAIKKSIDKSSKLYGKTIVQRLSSSNSNKFVTDRAAYQSELHRLRKIWQEEVRLKKQQEQEQKDLERKKIILERALKLREKRKESVARQEQAKKLREEANERYKTRLASNQVIIEERRELQRKRYEAAIKDLNEESNHWITTENIDQKITTNLFEAPATTGLTTRYSSHWRYHVYANLIDRETGEKSYLQLPAEEERANIIASSKFIKRMCVEDYLDSLIGSGEERAKYKELVDEFTNTVDEMGGLDYVDYYLVEAADGKAENDTHYEEIEGEEGVIVDADRTFDEDLELLSYEDFADVDSTDSYEPEVKQKKKRGK